MSSAHSDLGQPVQVEIAGSTSDDQLAGPKFERDDDSEIEESEQILRIKRNKQYLLEWVAEADFTKEVSLVQLSDHPFRLDDDEEEGELMNFSRILKVMKM